MTAYFDALDESVRGVDLDAEGAQKALESIEATLVDDASACVMMPGFPAQHALRLHQILNLFPVACRGEALPPVDVDTIHDYASRVSDLSAALHTVFHDVARCNVPGFTDSPVAPLRALRSRAVEARTAVWRIFGADWRPMCPKGHPMGVGPTVWQVHIGSSTVLVPGWAAQCTQRCLATIECIAGGFAQQERALRHEALVKFLSGSFSTTECVRVIRTEFLGLDEAAFAARFGMDTETLSHMENVAVFPVPAALREALLDALVGVKA